MHEVFEVTFDALHLRVDDSSVITQAVNMMDFGIATSVRQRWKKQMLQVDWEYLGEPFPSSNVQSISRVILRFQSARLRRIGEGKAHTVAVHAFVFA